MNHSRIPCRTIGLRPWKWKNSSRSGYASVLAGGSGQRTVPANCLAPPDRWETASPHWRGRPDLGRPLLQGEETSRPTPRVRAVRTQPYPDEELLREKTCGFTVGAAQLVETSAVGGGVTRRWFSGNAVLKYHTLFKKRVVRVLLCSTPRERRNEERIRGDLTPAPHEGRETTVRYRSIFLFVYLVSLHTILGFSAYIEYHTHK